MLTSRIYSAQEHQVWSIIFKQLSELIAKSGMVHSIISDTFASIPFDPYHIPEPHAFSKALTKGSGRSLCDAESGYLQADERFRHLAQKHFPVTNYIRKIEDIEFTPLPDLVHEYIGHMPQMFCQQIADIELLHAQIFYQCRTQAQKEKLYTLSRYTLEYGMIMEQGIPKVFGAGILSSIGDMNKAILGEFEYEKASLEAIISTKPSAHETHTIIYVFESIDMIIQISNDYLSLIQQENNQ